MSQQEDCKLSWCTLKKTVHQVSSYAYLMHYYRTNISKDPENIANTKVFHILGLDILIDKKNTAWLMEINSNPSLNIFLEREVPGTTDGTTEKVL